MSRHASCPNLNQAAVGHSSASMQAPAQRSIQENSHAEVLMPPGFGLLRPAFTTVTQWLADTPSRKADNPAGLSGSGTHVQCSEMHDAARCSSDPGSPTQNPWRQPKACCRTILAPGVFLTIPDSIRSWPPCKTPSPWVQKLPRPPRTVTEHAASNPLAKVLAVSLV